MSNQILAKSKSFEIIAREGDTGKDRFSVILSVTGIVVDSGATYVEAVSAMNKLETLDAAEGGWHVKRLAHETDMTRKFEIREDRGAFLIILVATGTMIDICTTREKAEDALFLLQDQDDQTYGELSQDLYQEFRYDRRAARPSKAAPRKQPQGMKLYDGGLPF